MSRSAPQLAGGLAEWKPKTDCFLDTRRLVCSRIVAEGHFPSVTDRIQHWDVDDIKHLDHETMLSKIAGSVEMLIRRLRASSGAFCLFRFASGLFQQPVRPM